MSKLGNLFRQMGAYLNLSEEPSETPHPQIGMQWSLVQHRAYKNPYTDAKQEILGNFQIATLDEKGVGIVENGSYYRVYKREKWDDVYQANFAHSRSAENMVGGGKIVPVYTGIHQPVSVTHKSANVIPFVYFEEPLHSILKVDHKSQSVLRPGY